MPLRGEVYFPTGALPPSSPVKHRIILLSSNSVASSSGSSVHLSVAIIISAINVRGAVRRYPLHSILVGPGDLSCLAVDSIVETHQLFSIPYGEVAKLKILGRLTGSKLEEVLAGARKLFS